jgi:hypothetical protein
MAILPFWIAEGARELDERSCPGRARRVESSRLRWRKDGDSAFLDRRGRKGA